MLSKTAFTWTGMASESLAIELFYSVFLPTFVDAYRNANMHRYLIDTHTHLFAEEFTNDIVDVIESAKKAKVCQFILPAIDSSSFDAMMMLAQRFPDCCFPTIGLHPTSVDGRYKEELAFVKQELDKHSFIAIGEVGIDCYWSVEYLEQQRYVFREQLQLALDRKLPVIIHSRESFSEIFAILREFEGKGLRGVFHSFSGTLQDYEMVKQLGGFKIGIGGVLTFKNSTLPALVKEIPIEDIVLETDSPYLTPVPHRGKRNESAYLALVAQRMAEVKGLSLAEVIDTTTQNAIDLFRLDKVSDI